jgi:hypothetical protein
MICRVGQYAIAVALLGFVQPVMAHTVECTAPTGTPRAAATAGSAGSTTPRAYEVEVSTSAAEHRTVIVTVRPRPSSRSSSSASGIEVTRVLLRSAYKSEAIAQPASFEHASGTDQAVATFDEAAVRALPQGDVNVILFTPDGERLCRIRKKDRGTLLHEAK